MYTHLQLRDSTRPPVSLATLHKMKTEGEKIASLTCYDASFAALVDEADADIVLVGDSLGMVIQGHDTTIPVTLENIEYHGKAVAAGLNNAMLMLDMPFGSLNSPQTFGHFGGSGTMMWIDPTIDTGLIALTDLNFDKWPSEALIAWSSLSDAVIRSLTNNA